jgi:hypothetical protein
VSALLFNEVRALGSAATRREMALVAKALRESGGEEVGRLLDYDGHPELWDRCSEMADEAGAYGFVQLDLAVAFHNPAHFPSLIAEPDAARRLILCAARARASVSGGGQPRRAGGKEDLLEPVLPEVPVEESEFGLDVRLQPPVRDLSERPKPGEEPCPQGGISVGAGR